MIIIYLLKGVNKSSVTANNQGVRQDKGNQEVANHESPLPFKKKKQETIVQLFL